MKSWELSLVSLDKQTKQQQQYSGVRLWVHSSEKDEIDLSKESLNKLNYPTILLVFLSTASLLLTQNVGFASNARWTNAIRAAAAEEIVKKLIE